MTWKYVDDDTPIACDVCNKKQMPNKIHSHRVVFYHVNKNNGFRSYQHDDLQTFGCCKDHSLQSLENHINSTINYGDYVPMTQAKMSTLPNGNDLYAIAVDYAMHGNSQEAGFSHWNMGDNKGLQWFNNQQKAIDTIEEALQVLEQVPHIDHEPLTEPEPIEEQPTQEIEAVEPVAQPGRMKIKK